MKKVLEKILNLILWINDHTPEVFLISVYLCSLLPFFVTIGSPMLNGAFMSFSSMVMCFIMRRDGEKPSRLYDVLGVTILILSFGNAFDLVGPIGVCFRTYLGGMWGMILGTMIFGFIENQRNEREREQKIERKSTIRRISIPESASVFNTTSDKIPVRSTDGGKIIGYINKADYNEFIHKNIIKE